MSRGFLLGKFLPPHRGHLMLCDFAKHYCDELTVLVVSRPDDPIDGGLRAEWMRELVPASRVVHVERDLPKDQIANPEYWQVWRQLVREAHPEPIDFLFSSEKCGVRLAEESGARYVPFDPGRHAAPIAGSDILNHPYLNWDWLTPPVRDHYVKTVCLFGPESTGKSTLAKKLATHYHTLALPEYGRTYCEVFGTYCTADDLRNIVKGQGALEAAARREANRLLILDTDRLMTALWADMLIGVRPPDIDAVERFADLYVLADIDIPWADDGTRYFPGEASRKRFYRICKEELERRGLPYVTIKGEREDRLKAAVKAIDNFFPWLRGHD